MRGNQAHDTNNETYKQETGNDEKLRCPIEAVIEGTYYALLADTLTRHQDPNIHQSGTPTTARAALTTHRGPSSRPSGPRP